MCFGIIVSLSFTLLSLPNFLTMSKYNKLACVAFSRAKCRDKSTMTLETSHIQFCSRRCFVSICFFVSSFFTYSSYRKCFTVTLLQAMIRCTRLESERNRFIYFVSIYVSCPRLQWHPYRVQSDKKLYKKEKDEKRRGRRRRGGLK